MPLSTVQPMNETMQKTRKRLIVEGHVQGVGYRALITLKARELKIKGYVTNLPDETVEIICEGEPKALDALIRAIDQKGDPTDVFSLHVVSIREAPPAPEGELVRFYTYYGRPLTDVERESFDREEIMVYRGGSLFTKMGIVGSNVVDVGQKVDGVGQKVDGVGQKVDGVGQKVDSMHADMNTRFDHMAEKYDQIAVSLTRAVDHLDRSPKTTDKATE